MTLNFDKQIKKMLGKSKKNSFSMKPFNLKPMLPKSKDWDFDGVPNWKDCQPRNTMRQDAKPNKLLFERFSKSLRLRDNPKLTPRENKTVQNSIIATFKSHPELMTEVEKRKKYISFQGKRTPLKKDSLGSSMPVKDQQGNFYGTVIGLNPDKRMTKNQRALVLRHELKHAEQYENLGSTDKINQTFTEEDNLKNRWGAKQSEIEAVNAQYDYATNRAGNTPETRELNELRKEWLLGDDMDQKESSEKSKQLKELYYRAKQAEREQTEQNVQTGMVNTFADTDPIIYEPEDSEESSEEEESPEEEEEDDDEFR